LIHPEKSTNKFKGEAGLVGWLVARMKTLGDGEDGFIGKRMRFYNISGIPMTPCGWFKNLKYRIIPLATVTKPTT